MIALLQPDLLEIGYSNPIRWKHIADVFASTGMIPREFSMDGFIYDSRSLDLSFLHRSLGASLLLFILISLIAVYIYRINGRLGSSLKELETINQREQGRNRVLELLAKGAPLTEILDALIQSVEAQSPSSLCSILLMDKDGKHLNVGAAPSLPNFYRLAINGLEIGANVGSCGTTAYTGKRTIVENVLTHPSWSEFKDLAAKAGLGSCWSEPIRASSGKILGTFAIYHHDAHKPSESDLQLIERAAHLAGIAIEKHAAEDELKKNTLLLTKLSAEVPGIVFQFRMTPDGHASFPFISEAVRKMYGLKPEELHEDASPFFAFRHPEDAARLAKSMQESARDLTPWHIEYRLIIPSQGVRWRLGDARPEKQEDGSIIWHGFITDISERKKVEERVRHMAQYDSLTDLPNRALLSDRLQLALSAAKREQTHLALMFIDLDRFKPINDKLGHAIGDELLKQVATRMQRCMRESDTVARIGGDEFVVLLPSIESEQDALLVAEKIRQAVNMPFEVDGNNLNVSTSIGISLYPQHGEDEITLSKNADVAMYYAKQGGRNAVTTYDFEMKVIGQ